MVGSGATEAHPIDAAIRAQIMQKLEALESDHQVRVLFACESGSRGWGFASPDSDYDVRFIYVHRIDEYLRILPGRDVIEEVPGPVFDVNGWDLRKALGLLAKGNATLIEQRSIALFVPSITTTAWRAVTIASICRVTWSARRSTCMCCALS
jgi:hypothetical protein